VLAGIWEARVTGALMGLYRWQQRGGVRFRYAHFKTAYEDSTAAGSRIEVS
jgi:hypothetical protein